jgi:hypothetical protein
MMAERKQEQPRPDAQPPALPLERLEQVEANDVRPAPPEQPAEQPEPPRERTTTGPNGTITATVG